MRNPFSFAIQPESGRLFVNDVGEISWEEINDATVGGLNFGWPEAEGLSTNPTHTNPVYTYDHTNARCAITGGTFFNPVTTTYPPNYVGNYFYQDYCTSIIHRLDLSAPSISPMVFGQNLPGQPVGLQTGLDGNLYFLSRHFSGLYKVIYTTNSSPEITGQPRSLTVSQGRMARFSVTTTGSAPLSYQWQRNEINIPGATSAQYVITNTAAADSGQYRVVVSNLYGSMTSDAGVLTVTIPNASPTAVITTPVHHLIYRAGDIISFAGTATDAEDGELPESAFTWTMEFHHDTHFHDGPPIATGAKSGQFTIPTVGETATNVFYRLILTVTDSRGATGSDTVDIDPKITVITLSTNRPGLQLALNGPFVTTPYTQSFVAGLKIGLTAPVSQTINEVTYVSKNWIASPDASGAITVPEQSSTFRAIYEMYPCRVVNSLLTMGISDVAANLIWQLDGYTDDSQFDVRWRPVGVSEWNTVNSLPMNLGGTGSYSLNGLTAETSYEWQIKAVCSTTANSGFSASTYFTTRGNCATLKSGSWNDITVWSCNRVPIGTDITRLRHDVLLPAGYEAPAQAIIYERPVRVMWEPDARLLVSQP